MEPLELPINVFLVSTLSHGQSDWIKKADVVLLVEKSFPEFQKHDMSIILKNFINHNINEYVNYKKLLNEMDSVKTMMSSSSVFHNAHDNLLMDKFSLLRYKEMVSLKKNCDIKSVIISKSIRGIATSNSRTKNNNGKDYQWRKFTKQSMKLPRNNYTTQDILKIIPPKIILVAQPDNVEFHNIKHNKLYKKKVVLKNINYVMAKYQVVRTNVNSNFKVMLNTLQSTKGKLAPGMHDILTIHFYSQLPHDYTEEIRINVKHGKTIIINVHAHRANPILEGIFFSINGPNISSIFLKNPNFVDAFVKNKQNLDHMNNNMSTTPVLYGTIVGIELDCNACFVGEEIIVKMMLMNVGGDGRFLLMTESDWHTMDINSLCVSNKIVMSCFTIWPAYFSLEENQAVIIHTNFSPISYGFHVDKFFILCDNFSEKSVNIFGDGIIFHHDFIRFGQNLKLISSNNEENNNDGDYWIIEMNGDMTDEILETTINLTNLCELGIFYRWEKLIPEGNFNNIDLASSSSSLLIEPMQGFWPAHTNLLLKITATSNNSVPVCYHYMNLQLIVEDIPRLAIPENYDRPIQPSTNRRRQCKDSVDICVENFEVWKHIFDVI